MRPDLGLGSRMETLLGVLTKQKSCEGFDGQSGFKRQSIFTAPVPVL